MAKIRARIGLFVASLVIAGAMSLLSAPATGAARASVETPQGHASEDAVALSPSSEAQLSRETVQKTATAAARAAAATAGDPGEVGQWGPVVEWPVVAINATVLPNGKVLAYASVGEKATETYPEQNHTDATVWDPTTGSQTNVTLNDGFNIFCSGLAQMTNGNLFVAGGNKDQKLDGIVQTHTFDWENDTWTQGLNMSYPRWYPSVTPMGNGEMLITSGGPPIPEVRQNDGTLRQLSSASLTLPLYPWLDVAPDGRAFESGPSQAMRSLNPSGAGSWQEWSSRDSIDRSYGSHAMYDIGKILVAGGGPSTTTADVIDINGATPTVTPTGSMAYGRRQNNLTVLADGTVLVTGGNSSGAELVDLNAGVYPAEVWNPATGQWTTLASMRVTRQYHSTALLLPDGRVLSAGGGICGTCDEVGYLNKNAEIFSPPYLFAKDGSGALAPRPTIGAAPGTVTEGTQFTVSTPDAASIRKVALVRLGAVTHSNNMEQRYVPVHFTAASGGLSVTAPSNVNIAAPGYYMLFIVNSAGVPSVAPIVRVAPPEAPPPPPPTEIPDPTAGGWTLNGSAKLTSTELELTEATSSQAGTAFWPTAVNAQNITLEYDATIGGGSGADGLALVFGDASRGAAPTSLGLGGGGLGFSGIPGVAVALDTYKNAVNPSNNFAGVSDGPTPTAAYELHWLATANLASPLENATNHVKVVTTSTTLTVFVNGTQVLSTNVTLPTNAYLGFSGGTGGQNDRHAISHLVVSNGEPPPPPPAASLKVTSIVSAPAGSPQAGAKIVFSGSCPSSFTTPALGNGESATPTLTGATEGQSCTVSETPPGGTGWKATATVNGKEVAVTSTGGQLSAPAFALVAGVNNVQFTNTYVEPPPTTIPDPTAGGWTLNGSAKLTPTELQLTEAASDQAGTAFWPTALNAQNITVEYDATIGGGSGADGLALVFGDASRGATPTSLGLHGGGLGFSGIPGVAVALDTFQNAVNPSNNFAGVSDGPIPTAAEELHWLATGNLAVPLENGTNHIKVVTTTTTVTVFVNGTQVVSTNVTLPTNAYLGFSGGTGGLNDRHAIAHLIVRAAPSVGGVTPNSGPSAGGTAVTIAGSNFNEVSSVKFGSADAASFSVNSASSITATSPAGTGTVDVTVATAGGISPLNESDRFSYQAQPAPTVTGLKPIKGPATGGTTVTITGTNFTGITGVTFGATNAARFVVSSTTTIKAVSPAEPAGTVDIAVASTHGTSAASLADHYKFGPPTITGLSPNAGSKGGGTSVTVTGTGFAPGSGTTEIKFGTTSGTSVNCSSITTCTVTAPAHKVGTINVRAVVAGMTSPQSPANQYTYS